MVSAKGMELDVLGMGDDDEEDLLAGIARPHLDLSHLDDEFPLPPELGGAPLTCAPMGEISTCPEMDLSEIPTAVSLADAVAVLAQAPPPAPPATMEELGLLLSPVPGQSTGAAQALGLEESASALPPPAPPPRPHPGLNETRSLRPISPPARTAFSHVRVLVADPQNGLEGAVVKALLALGFTCTVVETGAAARAELDQESYALCVLVVGGDASWVRLLLTAGRERWQHVGFVACLPAVDASAMFGLLEAGARDVLEPPYPLGPSLLARLHLLLPEQIPPSATDSHEVMQQLTSSRERLLRGIAEVASLPTTQPDQPQVAGSPREPSSPDRDAAVRDHVRLLETRVTEAHAETATLKLRVAELEGRLEQAGGSEAASPSTEALKAYIKTLEERAARDKDEMHRLKSRIQELEKEGAVASGVFQPSALTASYLQSAAEVALVDVRELLTNVAAYRQAVETAMDYQAAVAPTLGSHGTEIMKHVKTVRAMQRVLQGIYEKLGID